MRLILVSTVFLLLAGCGGTPVPVVTPASPVVTERESGTLIGLDSAALLTRFGQPRLRVREGDGTKLQFAGATCLLDAYLYPSGGAPRVTHVDARGRDGRSVDPAGCIALLEAR